MNKKDIETKARLAVFECHGVNEITYNKDIEVRRFCDNRDRDKLTILFTHLGTFLATPIIRKIE